MDDFGARTASSGRPARNVIAFHDDPVTESLCGPRFLFSWDAAANTPQFEYRFFSKTSPAAEWNEISLIDPGRAELKDRARGGYAFVDKFPEAGAAAIYKIAVGRRSNGVIVSDAVVVDFGSRRVSSEALDPPAGLGLSGPRFTIAGRAVFLLGFSYYGALADGLTLDMIREDLEAMKARGFNWFRVWANWTPYDAEGRGWVMEGDGTFRPEKIRKLRDIVELAESLALIVDVTARRDAPSLAGAHDAAGLVRLWTRLAADLREYDNVYFDLANEHDIQDARYVSDADIRDIADAVHAVDPRRLLTASSADPDLARKGLDFLAVHVGGGDPVWSSTFQDVSALVAAAAGRWPVHLQETFRNRYNARSYVYDDFRMHLSESVRAGAAGWCFHTNAGYVMSRARFFDSLDPEERRFVDRLAADVPR